MKTIFLVFFSLLVSLLYSQKYEDLAKTPPMGWSSWNWFGCEINEEIIKSVADALVSSDKFPSGIKSLVDYIHSKGLSGDKVAVCFFSRSENSIPLRINWQTFWGHEGIYGNGFLTFGIKNITEQPQRSFSLTWKDILFFL